MIVKSFIIKFREQKKMRKYQNKKGFTLIELLVVVAIIGILASVGVVAYNGYTASAQRGAAESNFNNVVKYMQAENQKCNLEARAFINPNRTAAQALAAGNSMLCDGRDAAIVVAATARAFLRASGANMSNPYSTATPPADAVSVAAGAAACANAVRGFITLQAAANTVTVTVCVDGDPATAPTTTSFEVG